METAGIAGLIALAIGLSKIIEKLIDRFVPKKHHDEVISDPRITRVVSILEAHDQNGVPLVYSPRMLVDQQTKMAELMAKSASSLEKIADQLDGINDHLDKHSEALSDLRELSFRGANGYNGRT